MSFSDLELVTQKDGNGNPVKKKTKSKLSLKMPSFFRSKHHQEDYDDMNTEDKEDEKVANDEKEISNEEDDSSTEKVEEKNESTSDPLEIPFKSSGACSASVLHEPRWPMTPPEGLHSCLMHKHRRRSATISGGDDLQEAVCQSKCNHVRFSPDTVDPPPRSCSYRKYVEAKSACPFRNFKHEKHKQKMGQLKKVNLSEFLSSSYQRSPLTFSVPCDMMF
ncbi:uncharacterized protein LOC117101300 [Anneissia japonica]|uniref:uncharacterized protein LOC117101300 n=1 Tax=Anneissia japonica TaxID=1529436 RepID=UPI0014256F12|nr:uncharacterized protein LOC117101300 [Anneissia japonica]